MMESTLQQRHSDSGAATIGVVSNLLITVVLIVGMVMREVEVARAFIVGGLYYALTTIVFVLIVTNTLSYMWATLLLYALERQRLRAEERLVRDEIYAGVWDEEQSKYVVYLEHRINKLEQASVQRQLPKSNFVTPYDNSHYTQAPGSTAQEALQWARTLYSASSGLPDPDKVWPESGMLIVKVIGSNRGGGSREAQLWLLDKGVLKRRGNNLALNLERYPTIDSLPG